MRHTITVLVLLSFCICLPIVADADQTSFTGGGQPYSNLQPSLAINYIVHTVGTTDELGEVMMFAGNFAPADWAFADGQLLDTTTNAGLFGLIGTTYGGGVGTFALPDLRGRTPIGMGTGNGLTPRTRGDTAGLESVTLTVDQLPPHVHATPSGPTDSTGGGAPHENMQPSLALNYGIAVEGIFPSRDSAASPGNVSSSIVVNQPFIASVGLFARNTLPAGFLPADGRLMAIVPNSALFSLLGSTYGGDGINTFALPDLRGRTAIHIGQGPGLSQQDLGERSGTETVTLISSQMPAHHHALPAPGGNTLDTGGNQPFNNMQPSAALHYIIALEGNFPTHSLAGIQPQVAGVEPCIGEVDLFAGDFAPVGWAFANGQVMAINQDTALFAVLGSTYGGNGVTTFALPDFRGRIGLGMGQGPGLTDFLVGTAPGTEIATLTVDQMPSHDHSLTVPEPSAFVHGALGLFSLAFVAWRRTRHRRGSTWYDAIPLELP
jgi:microcystin-dependent protein